MILFTFCLIKFVSISNFFSTLQLQLLMKRKLSSQKKNKEIFLNTPFLHGFLRNVKYETLHTLSFNKLSYSFHAKCEILLGHGDRKRNHWITVGYINMYMNIFPLIFYEIIFIFQNTITNPAEISGSWWNLQENQQFFYFIYFCNLLDLRYKFKLITEKNTQQKQNN